MKIEYDPTKTSSGLDAPANWHILERREDGIMWERITVNEERTEGYHGG
jgi:hypothetical protein